MEYLVFEAVCFDAVYSFLQLHRHWAGVAFEQVVHSSIDPLLITGVLAVLTAKSACWLDSRGQDSKSIPIGSQDG